jgi:thiamine biosynthesis lipoprotein
VIAGAAGVTLLAGLGLAARSLGHAARGETVEVRAELMGTQVGVMVWTLPERRAAAQEAAQAGLDEIARLEAIFSDYRADSEIGRLSRGETITPSPETRAILAESRSWTERSGGAFDPTFGALYARWREARRARALPSAAELADLTARGGWQSLAEEAGRLRVTRPGVRLDLGAIAKGWAAERVSALLARRGFPDHLVDCGGDFAIGGTRGGAPWRLAIPDPRGHGVRAILPAEPGTVATSGDYQRFFELGGVRYSHIVDPRTGWPPQGTASVTAIARAGADALATALYVLGPDRGLALVDRLPGAAAVFIDDTGRVRLSRGLRLVDGVIEARP